ncbi:MAG: hypothetical protein OER97_11665 [Gammaproteobacteria bacterium]|nr:hypothetical protein [Gammaproteobacteria bacterium]
MASKIFFKVGMLALCLGLLGCERKISFADDVQPIFLANCIECHDKSAEGYATSGFSLDDYDSVMKGTNFGPVVIANSSASSALYLVVAHQTSPEIHMPPHHKAALAEGRGSALSDDQVEIIRVWIDQGALNN